MSPLSFARRAVRQPTSPLWLPDPNPRQGSRDGFIPCGRCQRLAGGGCLASRPRASRVPAYRAARTIQRGDHVMTATTKPGTLRVLPGSQFPPGASPSAFGTNFAVTSSVADAVTLCLFDDAGTETQIPLVDY